MALVCRILIYEEEKLALEKADKKKPQDIRVIIVAAPFLHI